VTHSYSPFIISFLTARKPLVDEGLLVVIVSRSYSVTPHSVGLFWTSDQPDTETLTWQHTVLTSDRYLCHRWDSNRQCQQTSNRHFRNICGNVTEWGLLRAVSHIHLRKTIKLHLHLLFICNVHIKVIACLQFLYTCKVQIVIPCFTTYGRFKLWNKFRKNGRLVIDGSKGKGKVIQLQARCGPEGGYRYNSTLPWPRH